MEIATDSRGDIILSGREANQLNIPDFISQRVHQLLRSKPGDWELSPAQGINIAKYYGYPNIPATKTLIEREVSEELSTDPIVGAFDIEVIYTPSSSNSGIIEIIIGLPDGTELTMTEILELTSSTVNQNEGEFTPALYDRTEDMIRTERITLENRTNVIELKYRPITDVIFVLPSSSVSGQLENGIYNPPVFTETQNEPWEFTVDFDQNIEDVIPYVVTSGVVAYVDNEQVPYNSYTYTTSDITISGEATSSVLIDVTYDMSGIANEQQLVTDIDTRKTVYPLNTTIRDIMDTKLVSSLIIKVGDTVLFPSQYSANSSAVKLVEYPHNDVNITVDYYNTSAISSTTALQQDSKPDRIFPRSRETNRYMITTRELFNPGTYFVQYTSYRLGV